MLHKETDAEWWWYLLKVGQELEPTALPLFHTLGGGGMAGLFIYWQSPSSVISEHLISICEMGGEWVMKICQASLSP